MFLSLFDSVDKENTAGDASVVTWKGLTQMFPKISDISLLYLKDNTFVLSLAICKDKKWVFRNKFDFDDLKILFTIELFFKSVYSCNCTYLGLIEWIQFHKWKLKFIVSLDISIGPKYPWVLIHFVADHVIRTLSWKGLPLSHWNWILV